MLLHPQTTQETLYALMQPALPVSRNHNATHDAMHAAQGVVHRSLRPDNLVFYEPDQRWRLLGLARWARSGTDAPLVYNLRYTGPEVPPSLLQAACCICWGKVLMPGCPHGVQVDVKTWRHLQHASCSSLCLHVATLEMKVGIMGEQQ